MSKVITDFNEMIKININLLDNLNTIMNDITNIKNKFIQLKDNLILNKNKINSINNFETELFHLLDNLYYNQKEYCYDYYLKIEYNFILNIPKILIFKKNDCYYINLNDKEYLLFYQYLNEFNDYIDKYNYAIEYFNNINVLDLIIQNLEFNINKINALDHVVRIINI